MVPHSCPLDNTLLLTQWADYTAVEVQQYTWILLKSSHCFALCLHTWHQLGQTGIECIGVPSSDHMRTLPPREWKTAAVLYRDSIAIELHWQIKLWVARLSIYTLPFAMSPCTTAINVLQQICWYCLIPIYLLCYTCAGVCRESESNYWWWTEEERGGGSCILWDQCPHWAELGWVQDTVWYVFFMGHTVMHLFSTYT